MSIFIWEWADDYSAMQWPCPDGFHIPNKNEWAAVKTIWTTLWGWSSDGNSFSQILHLPYVWQRAHNWTWGTGVQWTEWWYRTCNYFTSYSAYELRISSSQINANTWYYYASWACIRAFKDIPSIPNSNWTKLYWTSIEAWGIFWNSADWLISLSSDWITWITIADKNVWATNVWNSWNTLNQSNCGNYFQRWNNYKFPFTWNVSTSWTQVDASNYWPWNYYNWDKFIVWNYNWSSVQNNNLRWWETWITKKPNIKDIFIWEWVEDYSAMQWPAPDGFHVPLQIEWQAVYDIWTALWWWGSDWTNFWIALKLPFAGTRIISSASVDGQGTYGEYWSSSSSNANYAYILYLNSTTILPQYNFRRAAGYSVRCFKNSPTIPTSSWTKLYWTSIESWWIFWSSTDWLISLSSDWQNWITISDKNLWATQVWNSWDTLSQANCGNYYQRGNNYWFPRTWSVTTSSTQVDASNYWPWNYYNSSTFITWNQDRSSVQNDNLRWWETWIVKKWNVKEVYVWDNLVRPMYFATKWPCPDRFHVPTKDELNLLLWILQSFWWIWTGSEPYSINNWSNIAQSLLLASAWDLYTNGTYTSRTNMIRWYSSSSAASNNAYSLYMGNNTVYLTNYSWYSSLKWRWLNIRPFKNTAETPDGNWTVLYQWAWNSWFYHNSSLEIISASSDWINWITLSDKNLWATSTDTSSQSSYGNYYQRWNNYWFPSSWFTKSSTQVNASSYWPWNYYSSSTFITWDNWDSSWNVNLRWWEDGNVPV